MFKKIFFLNNLDFGDILFYWKDKNSQLVSERYYHAFTLRELKKTAKNFDINIDKYNYWASYRNLSK